MELEELQAAWTQMSTELEHQKKMTSDIILQMTKEKYRNTFKTLRFVETVGAIFCYLLVIGIFMYFYKLDTFFLQLSGIVIALFLATFPILTLTSLYNIQKTDIISGSFKNNLSTYLKRKNKLLKLQQTGIYISLALTFFAFPLALKLISNKNIHDIPLRPQLFIALCVVVIGMIWVCVWGYKCYKNTTASAEKLIQDLE